MHVFELFTRTALVTAATAVCACASACNDGLIDPGGDIAIHEVDASDGSGDGDTGGDASPDAITPTNGWSVAVEHLADGLAVTVCPDVAFDVASASARFGERAVTPTRAPDDSVDGDAHPHGCVDVHATGLAPGKHSLTLALHDAAGVALEPLWLPLWVEATPFDWRRALLYMLMVDRFRDADGSAAPTDGVPTASNYQGGDFAGVVAAIDDGTFERLGVDTLWLTPVLDNAEGGFLGIDNVHLYSGYHGYWPVSASAIEARFARVGADPAAAAEAFRDLVRRAHARGMRIVMDVVLNHVHEAHPYCSERPAMCKRTCVCGTAGCDWEQRALDCQFASYLPDLDYRDAETRARVVADVLTFVRDFDIDGLRLDAVKHMDPSVLQALRAPLDLVAARGGAPLWLVGETFASGDQRALVASYLGPDGLDGQFDFPLYWTLRDTFVNDGSFRNLESALQASAAAYGEHLALMSPFSGNHDVERFATALAKNDLGPWGGTVDVLADNHGDTPQRWDVINPLTMGMAFTLTLPGVPLLYMGDELGLGGSNDPDNRRLLPTAPSTDQAEVLRRVRELGRARREHPVLATGARRELWQDDDLYVQARWGDGDVVLIAMNKGDARTVTVTLPAELGAAGARFQSVLSDRSVGASGDQLELSLAPWEYVLLDKVD